MRRKFMNFDIVKTESKYRERKLREKLDVLKHSIITVTVNYTDNSKLMNTKTSFGNEDIFYCEGGG